MGFIYKLDFENGKSYVGQTKISVKTRFSRHSSAFKRGVDYLIYKAWNKYGEPKCTTLIECNDLELDFFEKKFIDLYDTFNFGYNSTDGSSKSPSTCPSVAKKISNALKGVKKSPEHIKRMSEVKVGKQVGDKNPMFGKKRQDLAEFNKTKRGVPISDSQKAKQRERMSGSQNPRYGISGEKHPLFGKKMTAEQIEKRVAAYRETVKKRKLNDLIGATQASP